MGRAPSRAAPTSTSVQLAALELARDTVLVVRALLDENLPHQQKVAVLSFGFVVINAPSNRIQDLTPLVPEIVEALNNVRPGTVEHVGPARKRKDRSADIGQHGQR